MMLRSSPAPTLPCEQVAAGKDYDFRTEFTGSSLESGYLPDEKIEVIEAYVINANVSGDSFRMTLEGDTSGETVRVDGVTKHLNNSGEWVPDEYGIIDLNYVEALFNSKLAYSDEGHVLCPSGQSMGLDLLGDVSAEHFQLSEVVEPEPMGIGNGEQLWSPRGTTTWDYWTGRDGLLVKTKQVLKTDDGEQRREFLTIISGVGEPNIIEAPW